MLLEQLELGEESFNDHVLFQFLIVVVDSTDRERLHLTKVGASSEFYARDI